MSNLVYWIWFASRDGIKARTKRLLLDRFEDAKRIYFAEKGDFEQIEDITNAEINALLDKETERATKIISRCEDLGVQILTFQDAQYPERLRLLYDAPYVLYIKGTLPSVDLLPVVAIVGTRKTTPYGEKMARNLGYEVARGGAIVATGLAEGADSRAAEGALMAQGKVIGVLGTAINEVYPKFNGRLFDDVMATGAIISEYPPDEPGSPRHFPARNRIISGISLGVAVCEAPLFSGSLITARYALEQGREVFAVPGNADSPNFRGSNALIRDGAKLIENGWDILCEYERLYPDKIFREESLRMPEERAAADRATHAEKPRREKKPKERRADTQEHSFFKLRVPIRRREKPEELSAQLEGLTENQLKIVGVLGKKPTHIDDIIDLCGLPASTVLSEMTLLQIKGVVSQEGGKRFRLNISAR